MQQGDIIKHHRLIQGVVLLCIQSRQCLIIKLHSPIVAAGYLVKRSCLIQNIGPLSRWPGVHILLQDLIKITGRLLVVALLPQQRAVFGQQQIIINITLWGSQQISRHALRPEQITHLAQGRQVVEPHRQVGWRLRIEHGQCTIVQSQGFLHVAGLKGHGSLVAQKHGLLLAIACVQHFLFDKRQQFFRLGMAPLHSQVTGQLPGDFEGGLLIIQTGCFHQIERLHQMLLALFKLVAARQGRAQHCMRIDHQRVGFIGLIKLKYFVEIGDSLAVFTLLQQQRAV